MTLLSKSSIPQLSGLDMWAELCAKALGPQPQTCLNMCMALEPREDTGIGGSSAGESHKLLLLEPRYRSPAQREAEKHSCEVKAVIGNGQ